MKGKTGDFMKVIDMYISRVKKEIYKLTPAENFLNELKNNLLDFSEDNPDCSMDDLVDQFGEPEELAREFLDTVPDFSPKEIARKGRTKKAVIVLLCIVLTAAATYCIGISMQTQSKATDVITIYE